MSLQAILVVGGEFQARKERIEELIRGIFKPFEVAKGDVVSWQVKEFKGEKVMDKIREQIKWLSLAPLNEAGIKVWVIYGFKGLSVPAQNALLKTLEEPLSGRYIILETDKTDGVLETILSRVEVVRVTQKGGGKTKGWLWLKRQSRLPYPTLVEVGHKLGVVGREKVREFLLESIEQMWADGKVDELIKIKVHEVLKEALEMIDNNVSVKHVMVDVLWGIKYKLKVQS